MKEMSVKQLNTVCAVIKMYSMFECVFQHREYIRASWLLMCSFSVPHSVAVVLVGQSFALSDSVKSSSQYDIIAQCAHE